MTSTTGYWTTWQSPTRTIIHSDPMCDFTIQSKSRFILVQRRSYDCVSPDESVDFGDVNVVQLLDSVLDLVFVCLDVHNEHQRVVVLNLLHGRLCGEGELDDGIVVQPGRDENRLSPELTAPAADDCGLWIGCISGWELESSYVILWSLKPSCAPLPAKTSGSLPLATYLFLRGALLRGYLGWRRRRRVLGRRKVGVVLIFFFLWLWTPLSTAFLAFKALDLASVLAGTAKTKGRILSIYKSGYKTYRWHYNKKKEQRSQNDNTTVSHQWIFSTHIKQNAIHCQKWSQLMNSTIVRGPLLCNLIFAPSWIKTAISIGKFKKRKWK